MRPRKESEILHCNLNKTISETLVEFCKETGLTKTVAIERALKLYLEQYNKTGKI